MWESDVVYHWDRYLSCLANTYRKWIYADYVKVRQLHSFPTEIFIINYNEAMQRSPMDSVQDSS